VVTGASGFIGHHTLLPLLQAGFEVHALSRRPSGEIRAEGLSYHTADLLDQVATSAVIRTIKPTHLLHLAWYVEPGMYWASLNNLSWVAASLALFRTFLEAGGRRAVFAGTCAEYDWSHEKLSEYATPLRSNTLYGRAKNALRELIEEAGTISDTSTAWGRIFYLYGPREPRGRLVSDAFNLLLKGQKLATTLGYQQRDFMHVADVGAAFAAVICSDVAGAINVASGRCVAVRQIVEMIGRLTDRMDLIEFGARASNPNEPLQLTADVARLTHEVGFTPKIPLEEGLADTLDWWSKAMVSEGATRPTLKS
jgi:nucleoside-diphosphate-sugar epimerase